MDGARGSEGRDAAEAESEAARAEREWLERLYELNPWARGLNIESDAFEVARRNACVNRWIEGVEVWNAWAAEMLALVSLEDSRISEEPPRRDPLIATFDALAITDFFALCFRNGANFAGFTFPGEAQFSYGTFSGGDARFENATFACGGVTFEGATFGDEARFDDAAFSGGNVTFSGVTFSGGARFSGATFSGDDTRFDDATFDSAWFDEAIFSGTASFSPATFRNATFDGAAFRTAYFDKAKFDVATFRRATFRHRVRFDGATFSQGASFNEASFNGQASFCEATFNGGDTWFSCTIFNGGDTWFTKATFNSSVLFDYAQFGGGCASFEGAKFGQITDFSGTQFTSTLADFSRADFSGPVTFDDSTLDVAIFRSIKSERSFSMRATFQKTPDFREASFHEPPQLDDAVFEATLTRRYVDGERRPLPLDWAKHAPNKNEHAKFRALRGMAEQGNDHTSALRFNANEIAARRFWVDEPFGRNASRFWLGWLYQLVSDYGRSILRPLIGLFAVVATFAALFYAGAQPDVPRTPWARACHESVDREELKLQPTDKVTEAISLSIRNALIFDRSDTSRRTYGCLYGLVDNGRSGAIPTWVGKLSLLESLLSAIFLFLIGLALRNMFRLG